jgi:hypothetical protein
VVELALGEPEVDEPRVPVDAEDHVPGLHVPVDEPHGVNALESGSDVVDQARDPRLVERAALEGAHERLARDELHDVVEGVALATGVDEARDARAVDRAEELALAVEAGDRLGIGPAGPGVDELERERLASPFLLGDEDGPHAAPTEDPRQGVVAETPETRRAAREATDLDAEERGSHGSGDHVLRAVNEGALEAGVVARDDGEDGRRERAEGAAQPLREHERAPVVLLDAGDEEERWAIDRVLEGGAIGPHRPGEVSGSVDDGRKVIPLAIPGRDDEDLGRRGPGGRRRGPFDLIEP